MLSISLVAVLLLTVGCMGGICKGPSQGTSAEDENPEEEPEQITDRILAVDAYALMEETEEYQIIDLRPQEDFEIEHIPGAINIHIQSENFRDEIDELDRDMLTMAYYHPYGLPMPMGFQRPNETMNLTVDAHTLFKELGFQEAYLIKGGVVAWKFEGLPTIEGDKSVFRPTKEAFYADSVTAGEAFALMQDETDYTVIDTRTQEEFDSEHIPGAINIGYESGNFREELGKLDKQKTTFVYHRPYGVCSFQYCPTSESLSVSLDMIEIFRELKFRETHLIQGGVVSWKFEGLPTVKP
ncbi:MAG: rhodanese-like domain-containing protein [Dehalococcoidales bacterium]